jgi:TM2 domain-containing membrane protein YozV
VTGLCFCPACGKQISQEAPFCPACGHPNPSAGRYAKNKLVAALLALFLGGLGVHKFYLGKIGQGILYLVFCWTFIPWFIAFIEAIIYFATSDENFARKYS